MTPHPNISQFRSLHTPHTPLLLPNSWDAASARIIENAGAKAIATTSAGIAWSLGSADGNHLDLKSMIAAIARTVAAVSIPVTADIEGGYANHTDELAHTITEVINAGAVGINIEDTHYNDTSPLRPIEEQCERIRCVKTTAGNRLFINARVDTYLNGAGTPATCYQDTIERARAYVASGADSIFVPGLAELASIAELVDSIDAPLNVMAGPNSPTVDELANEGVARISLGPAIAQAGYALAARASKEFLTAGTYGSLNHDDWDFTTINSLMT